VPTRPPHAAPGAPASPVDAHGAPPRAAPPSVSPAAVPNAGSGAPTPARGIRREPPATPVVLPPIAVENASASPRVAGDERPPRQETPKPASRTRTFVGTAALVTGKLELEGIVFSDTNPTALINGRVVAPGSYVEGYTVVRIEATRVELTDDRERIVLTLK
jgi:hypothetical protein